MPFDLKNRLRRLPRGHSAHVAAALAGAIDHAEPGEASPLAEALAALGTVEAAAAVVRRLHRLGDARLRLLRSLRHDVLAEAVQRASTARPTQARVNAFDLIGEHRLVESLGTLADALQTHRDEPAEDAAAKALLRATVGLAGEQGRRRTEPATTSALDAALARAIASPVGQRREDVRLAAALVSRRAGPRLAALLDGDGDDDAGARAVRSVAARLDLPLVRRNLVNWLAWPAMTRAAIRGLERVVGDGWFDDVLHSGRLLRLPARRRALRMLVRPLRALPTITTTVRLSPESQRGAVEFLVAAPISAARRVERLADCVALPDPSARLSALRALLAIDHDDAIAAIRAYCFDAEAAVAMVAAQAALARAEDPPVAFLDRLCRSPHPRVREQAMARRARLDGAGFFRHFEALPPTQAAIAARHALRRDRGEFIECLRRVIATGSRRARIGAISLAGRIDVVEDIELELLQDCLSSDEHVASAAAAALRASTSRSAAEALRAALRSAAPRVRANAAEALAARDGANALPLLEPLLRARHARSRANALAAFVRHGSAGEVELHAMLRDRDPAHRVSAAWAAGRARCTAALPELAALTGHDVSRAVRAAAARAKRRLEDVAAPRSADAHGAPAGDDEASPSRAATSRRMTGHAFGGAFIAIHAGGVASLPTQGLDSRVLEPALSIDPAILGWTLTCVGAALLVHVVVRRMARERVSGRALSRRFSRKLGVRRRDFLALERLATASGMRAGTSVASMLLSRGCFDHALAAGGASVSGADAARAARVRRVVFGGEGRGAPTQP